MTRYAEGTTVAVSKTKGEIEAILTKYGADQYGMAIEAGRAMVAFRIDGRHVRFVLPLDVRDDEWVWRRPGGGVRSQSDKDKRAAQEERRRWRALFLIIKAKLEASTSGIVTLADEFAPYTVLPDGRTVAEWLHPQIDAALEAGTMPADVPGLGPGPLALGPGEG